MVELDAHGRVMLDTRLYGVGKWMLFVYEHYFHMRMCLFALACLMLSAFSFRLPMFVFIIIEVVTLWCQYKAPMMDEVHRAEFAKWVDESLTIAGGESCQSFNAVVNECYEQMMPDFYSDWYAAMGTESMRRSMPGVFKNINVTKYSYGYTPPRCLQLVTEDPPFPGSAAFLAPTVFANELAFEFTFTMFGFPCTIVVKDFVMYATLRVIVETPEERRFMHLSPITCVVYTTEKPFKLMSATVLWNGFNIMRVPMLNHAWLLFTQSVAMNCLGNGECMYADWITGCWKWRNFNRVHSDMSETLFRDISDKIKDEEKPGRFSMPTKDLKRWNEALRAYHEQIEATPLAPNEELIWGTPNYADAVEPIIEMTKATPILRDISI